MAATLYNLDFVNLFIGDEDPTDSQYLVLKDVKLPMLDEQTKSHSGGGATAEVELGMRQMAALSMGFNLEGVNPDVLGRFMPINRIKYTIRGNMRDIKSHSNIEVRGIIEGRMTKVDVGQFQKSDGVATEYEVKEIVFYQLLFGGDEKFYFDYFAGPAGMRTDGVDMFPGAARNIGLV